MPNFVFNTLQLFGNKTQIYDIIKPTNNNHFLPLNENSIVNNNNTEYVLDKYFNFSLEESFSLCRAVPPPLILKNNDFYSPNINWFIENWGTKWDARDSQISESDDCIEVIFNTAWSTPITWFEKVSKKYPDIKMINYFIEETYELYGVIVCVNGEYFEHYFQHKNDLKGLQLFARNQQITYQDMISFNNEDEEEVDYELYFKINDKIKKTIHPFLGIKLVENNILTIGYYNTDFDYQKQEIVLNPTMNMQINRKTLTDVQSLLSREYKIYTEISKEKECQLIID